MARIVQALFHGAVAVWVTLCGGKCFMLKGVISTHQTGLALDLVAVHLEPGRASWQSAVTIFIPDACQLFSQVPQWQNCSTSEATKNVCPTVTGAMCRLFAEEELQHVEELNRSVHTTVIAMCPCMLL